MSIDNVGFNPSEAEIEKLNSRPIISFAYGSGGDYFTHFVLSAQMSKHGVDIIVPVFEDMWDFVKNVIGVPESNMVLLPANLSQAVKESGALTVGEFNLVFMQTMALMQRSKDGAASLIPQIQDVLVDTFKRYATDEKYEGRLPIWLTNDAAPELVGGLIKDFMVGYMSIQPYILGMQQKGVDLKTSFLPKWVPTGIGHWLINNSALKGQFAPLGLEFSGLDMELDDYFAEMYMDKWLGSVITLSEEPGFESTKDGKIRVVGRLVPELDNSTPEETLEFSKVVDFIDSAHEKGKKVVIASLSSMFFDEVDDSGLTFSEAISDVCAELGICAIFLGGFGGLQNQQEDHIHYIKYGKLHSLLDLCDLAITSYGSGTASSLMVGGGAVSAIALQVLPDQQQWIDEAIRKGITTELARVTPQQLKKSGNYKEEIRKRLLDAMKRQPKPRVTREEAKEGEFIWPADLAAVVWNMLLNIVDQLELEG